MSAVPSPSPSPLGGEDKGEGAVRYAMRFLVICSMPYASQRAVPFAFVFLTQGLPEMDEERMVFIE